jgi:nucleotide-binding universal stress UspA family protein
MFNVIVVAVDDSDPAEHALELACSVAAAEKSKLILVNVLDVSKLVSVAGYETPYPAETIDILRDAGKKLLDEKAAICNQKSVATETYVAEGDAADAILQVAGDKGASLIVMGTHGRKGISHLFIGSVAEEVLKNATIPVLVTK